MRHVLSGVCILAAVPFVLAVIIAPLDLIGQWTYAAGVVGAVILAMRLKSRRATLFVCLLAVLASTRYIWWRTTHTLAFGSPLEFVLGIGLYFAELYAWVILVLGIMQTSWPLPRPVAPLRADASGVPTVDVFIPTYNESLEIVRTTVFAAMAMDYPSDRFRVFILDDGRRPEFRQFAQKAGCGYLTRADNLHAKAGNLNAAMKLTGGELICVFDCDHVPTRAFLQMTVGWFQVDPKLAVAQTPHHFYSPDPAQRNVTMVRDLPGEGDLFYGSVQGGNDLWNATFFCGSCAVIRRAALEQTNGFAGETVTEDAHTALKLQRKGWNTAYLAARLSAGLATERLVLHIGQRIRWARGMTQIFRIDNPMLGPGLSFPQRLCYLNAMLHFQFPLPRICFLLSPLAYLLAGQNVIHASAALIFANATPHLATTMYSSGRLQGTQRRVFWGEIYETLLAFHLVRPTLMTWLNPRKGKFNVTDKGATLDRGYFDGRTLRPHLIAAGLLILGIIAGAAKILFPKTFGVSIPTLLLNTGWTIFNLMILIPAIAVGRETRQVRSAVRFAAELPVSLYYEDGHVVESRTMNVSMGGLAIHNPAGSDPSSRVITHVGLTARDSLFVLPVKTVAVVGGLARVRFMDLSLAQERQLTEALMSRADAWQHTVRQKAHGTLEGVMDILKITVATLVVMVGSIRLPRRAGAAMVAVLVSVLAVAALVVALGGVASAQSPGPVAPAKAGAKATAGSAQGLSGVENLRVTLKDLRVENSIRLKTVQGEIAVPFGMSRDQVVTKATLTLNLGYSPALLPELSHLVVLLNGEIVHSIPLLKETANGLVATIPVQPGLFIPGQNQLNLRFIGHYTYQCEDPLNSTLWSNISNLNSFFDLTVQKLPPPHDLGRLPLPFFDPYQVQPLNLPFTFAGPPTSGELEAAASVAGWFGSLASYRGFSFKPRMGGVPTGDVVVFFNPSHPVPGIVPPGPVTGPMLAIITNPSDAFGSVLLVMGRNDAELKQAAAVLATGANALGGPLASVGDARVPEMARYSAPRWLPTNRAVQLGEIVKPTTLQGRGLDPGPLAADFRMAPDLFFWPRAGAKFKVGYTYPVARWLDRTGSRLDLSVNGQYLKSFRLRQSSWTNLLQPESAGVTSHHDLGEATLPAYALFGQNQVSLYYDLQIADKRRCVGTLPTDVSVGIDPTSSIDLRGAHHAALLPNLALMVGGGFPFTRAPDLAETAAVVPNDISAPEIEAFLLLMGDFGDATGSPPTRLTVVRDGGGSLAGKDVLVIGRTSLARADTLFDTAPVHWEGDRLQIAQRSTLSRIWSFFAPSAEVSVAKFNDAQLISGDFTGMTSFRSPADRNRVVVAFLASRPDQLPALVHGLTDPKVNAQIQGDLAIPTADRFQSFRVGTPQWSGDLSWWLMAEYWISQRPLFLALAAILAAIIIAIPVHFMMKAQQRRRLSMGPE